MNVSDVVSLANGLFALAGSVAGVGVALAFWFRKMLRRELDSQLTPVSERLEKVERLTTQVRSEVSLNGGASLKDGVYAIANHLGVRFAPLKVTVEIAPKEDE